MTLHMLHLPVWRRALFECGRGHGLVDDRRAVDTGYLVHALLARLLGPDAPKPFDIQDDTGAATDRRARDVDAHDRPLAVLAYADTELAVLVARARQGGDQAALAAVAWDAAAGKPLPPLPANQRLGFRVRVCPTVRIGRLHPRFEPGAEVDPYVALIERGRAAREAAHPTACPDALKNEVVANAPSREAVYRDWLVARVGGAAHLEAVDLVSVKDARLWRRGDPGDGAARSMHGRTRGRFAGRGMIGRRDAVFEGMLRVGDPSAFAALLARGVGRHRAFGFGMLLLRPAGASSSARDGGRRC